MSRIRASLIHLFISAIVVGLALAVIFFFWYPDPYFKAAGTWRVIQVLVGVDLVVGPVLTLILFKSGKPRLKFDLSVIALIQVVALTYGTTVIYQERPYFSVFAVDRFEIVTKGEVDVSKIEYEELMKKPLRGPLLVFAAMPENMEAQQRLLMEVLLEGKPDLDRRPEYYEPYLARKEAVLEKARPLSDLLQGHPDAAGRIDRLTEKHKTSGQLAFVPLVGRNSDHALVLSGNTGLPIGSLDVDPWLEEPAPNTE